MRYYLIPTEKIIIPAINPKTYRGPMYFQWLAQPVGIPQTRGGSQQYGYEGLCLHVTEITPENHNVLKAKPNVFFFPMDMTAELSNSKITELQTYLEANNIPSEWITAPITSRQIVRRLYHIFSFFNELCGIAGHISFFDGNTLETKYNDLTPEVKGAILTVTAKKGLDTTKLSLNPTLRQILRTIRKKLEATPVKMMGAAN